MKYQIDQSGKIEDTRIHTVIACSNKKQFSIMIKATTKRKIKKIYNLAGKPNIYTIQVFSVLIYLLIEKANITPEMIVIDREYKGKEQLIKSYIMQLVFKRGKIKLSKEDLHFAEIGRKSQAHKTAIQAFRKKKADFEAKEDEVIAQTMLF
jgi:hypothetical protein